VQWYVIIYFFNWFADGDGMRISIQTISRITFLPLLVCEKNRRPASTVDKLATKPMMLSTNLVSSVSVMGIFVW